jgi:hypothetical protein
LDKQNSQIVKVEGLGEFRLAELTVEQELRARGLRAEMCAGQFGTMAISPLNEERLAATFAQVYSVLAFAVVKVPDEVTLSRLPLKVLDQIYTEYRAKFPDPFRVYTDGLAAGAGTAAQGS